MIKYKLYDWGWGWGRGEQSIAPINLYMQCLYDEIQVGKNFRPAFIVYIEGVGELIFYNGMKIKKSK